MLYIQGEGSSKFNSPDFKNDMEETIITIKPSSPDELEQEEPFINPCPKGYRYDFLDECCREI